MGVTGVSGTNLFPGSLTLTRAQAEARGMTSYDVTNGMTGEKSESYTVSLSGYSLSLLKNAQGGFESAEPTQAGDFVRRYYGGGFGPTQGSLHRMDALRAAAAEDRPAVERVFADQLAQAGIDPASSFTMTRTFNPDTHQYPVTVGRDFAEWRQVEDLLNSSPALLNDIQRVWGQQTLLSGMEVIERTLKEGASGGQDAINQAWLDHGRNDLANSQMAADTMSYRGGRIVSASAEVADIPKATFRAPTRANAAAAASKAFDAINAKLDAAGIARQPGFELVVDRDNPDMSGYVSVKGGRKDAKEIEDLINGDRWLHNDIYAAYALAEGIPQADRGMAFAAEYRAASSPAGSASVVSRYSDLFSGFAPTANVSMNYGSSGLQLTVNGEAIHA